MPSTSSIVLDFLKQQSPGYTYTAEELYDELKKTNPTVTIGGVGGFSSKAAEKGALTATRIGRIQRYTLVDMSNIVVRDIASPGGAPGRQSHHIPRAKAVSIESVREKLFDLACQLESAHTPLSMFSTEELLAELMKRNKVKK